jgi:hypothetical protein
MQMYRWINTKAFLDVNTPGNIAGPFPVSGAAFNPTSISVTGNVVLAEPNQGCTAFTNSIAISGKIALIDRGDCTFLTKVTNAKDAGAIGVIICNNLAGGGTFNMGGVGLQSIPSVMVSFEDCQILKAELGNGLNVTLEISTPRVQDSDLDNGIIAHEYGHGISNRLTGGAANTGCLGTSEQMGEGWSDYFALMLQLKPGDDGADRNGIGTYSIDQDPNGDGIRPFPYSTDLSINPFSYNDIAAVSIPHGVGSVWCTMLWDMTWNLIEKHGFVPDVYNITGGNGIAMQLVMEGLKLQPCSLGFVDGRDAILMADTLLFAGANSCEIWRAFARRGLGLGASQGDPNILDDGIESYVAPDGCFEPCTDQSLTYSSEIIPDGTAKRVNTIITIDHSTVAAGTEVTLIAGQEISIQPLFEVLLPTVLLLDAKPCDDSYLPAAVMAKEKKEHMIQQSAVSSGTKTRGSSVLE